MTLCIAANAQQGGQPRIVLCCDSLIADDYSATDSECKFDVGLADNLTSLFAGSVEDADDLLRFYKRRLSSQCLTLDNLKRELNAGMREFKDWLVGNGREATTDLQLIVAGFFGNTPRLVYVSQDTVTACPSNISIGIGGSFADTMLRWRKHSRHAPLANALYYVYEAKKFGELSRDVGKLTTIIVLEPDVREGLLARSVNSRGIEFLESQFERYGPQSFERDWDAVASDDFIELRPH